MFPSRELFRALKILICEYFLWVTYTDDNTEYLRLWVKVDFHLFTWIPISKIIFHDEGYFESWNFPCSFVYHKLPIDVNTLINPACQSMKKDFNGVEIFLVNKGLSSNFLGKLLRLINLKQSKSSMIFAVDADDANERNIRGSKTLVKFCWNNLLIVSSEFVSRRSSFLINITDMWRCV